VTLLLLLLVVVSVHLSCWRPASSTAAHGQPMAHVSCHSRMLQQ
jgi:hypothetical protein